MTPTPTPAARVSGTIKALYERACNLVRHEADCPARGRGDEYCKCDAVPFLNDFEALAAIQPDPEPQPVAWYLTDIQGRLSQATDRPSDAEAWREQGLVVTHLYATPSSAGTVSVEAAALREIADGYGPQHLSKYCRDIALRALAGEGGR